MRVLLVVHGYPPAALGGTELYTAELARTLREQGEDVHVLARESDPSRPDGARRQDAHHGIPVRRVNNTFRSVRAFTDTYRDPRLLRAAMDIVRELRPDVVHVQHLTGLSAELPEALAAAGVPSVMTLQDYWTICHRGQLLDRRLQRCAGPLPAGCRRCIGAESGGAATHAGARWLPRGGALRRLAAALVASSAGGRLEAASARASLDRAHFMRRQLGAIDVLLAPSRTLRERFLAFGVDAQRLRLHECGIPVAPQPRRDRANGEPLRIGFLGSLMVSKGAHLLLRAFGRLPAGAATLHVHGDPVGYHGDDSHRRELEPLLRQPGVVHDGSLDHDAVPAALAALDVVVVPSIWIENSPFVIREAFAAGVPVVASRLGGMAELVTDGTSGLLFAPDDEADLARCLRRLVDEPELLPCLRAGIPRVRDVADDAAATRELYRELCASRRHGAHVDARASSRLAAVVLHYRTPEDTLLAVRSLLASRLAVDDLIVVDNDSGDGSTARLRAELPETTILAAERNLGFSGGCNLGIREALRRGADRVLLLNSDALLPPDALDMLDAALADPAIGIAGPLLLSRSDPGRIASAGMTYDPRTGRMLHHLAGAPVTSAPPGTRRVDGIAGCAMLVRRDVLERVGLLAEEYFFSFEDLDLCLRARAAGLATVVVGAARGYHEGGRSIGPSSPARLYYATRNHLLLAHRQAESGEGRRAVVRIVGWNVAHAVLTAGIPRAAALRAVLHGIRDHRRGRYGPAPS